MDLGERIRKGVNPKPIKVPEFTPTKAPVEPEKVPVPLRKE